MSSVMIKGMKMPHRCSDCIFYNADYCMQKNIEHRECAIVELPEKHGRLIDADAFMADICRSINEMTKIGIMVDGDYLWCKLEDALENAPTIVESEGE